MSEESEPRFVEGEVMSRDGGRVGLPRPSWPRRFLARLLAACVLGVLALALCAAGIALTLSVIGAFIGIPLFFLGLGLAAAALWIFFGGGIKFIALAAALASLAGFPRAAAAGKAPPRFRRVMIVVFENTDFKRALAQPFMRRLAARGALLTDFYAETHPSQPNYIALVSGSPHGVTGDDPVTVRAKNVADLLQARGKTWKAYAEGYPGRCFLGARAGAYARKHMPFLSFADIQDSPARCARVVPAAELSRDIARRSLPDYMLYIPDLNDDGHDTSPEYADGWMSGRLGPLIKNPEFMKGTLLVLTFDEDSRGRDDRGRDRNHNRICTVLYGDMVRPGSSSNRRYDHYSLLRLAEDAWGLGRLGSGDAGADSISGVWRQK
ncbi:MAG: alkaline phosphatase family protein [Elusimicrobiota bacterium]